MATVRALLDEAQARLTSAGVPSPRVDAELLLAHLTGRPRALLRLVGEVPDDQAETYAALVERRAGRVPLQHLTGVAPFRRLELVVGPGVFVPRPETELLVDAVLDHLGPEPGHGLIVVDPCTGSGSLALALATELAGSTVHAVELDPGAAAWARRNVEAHAGVVSAAGSRLELHAGDAVTLADPGGPLAALAGVVDVVVSNPPYIPDGAIPREPEVRDHDPVPALFGGPDGLDVVRGLVAQASLLLRPGGLLVIEHADVQGEAAGMAGVPGVLRASRRWRDVLDHVDLAGLPRFTTAVRSHAARADAAPADAASLPDPAPTAPDTAPAATLAPTPGSAPAATLAPTPGTAPDATLAPTAPDATLAPTPDTAPDATAPAGTLVPAGPEPPGPSGQAARR